MAPTYNTTTHGLRWLPGSNLASDIDAGFQALAEDVDTKLLTGGKSIIATAEARTNTAYGLLTTPDRVQSVVVPTGGIVQVWYQALWKESVAAAARANLFVGSNEVQWVGSNLSGSTSGGPGIGGTPNSYVGLSTAASGLISGDGTGSYAGTYPTTGHVIGVIGTPHILDTSATASGPFGGVCELFAAAGTYDISVQFKASSGTVTVQDRRLWVRVLAF